MYEVNKVNKLITDQSVLIYKTKRNETIKCYISSFENNTASIVVYAPSKLNDFQIWNVDLTDLMNNSNITNQKASWGGR
tara:strand:+ start:952 stop:1188 length:237 start_codon:yes stop_codon:yes gene_type:complete